MISRTAAWFMLSVLCAASFGGAVAARRAVNDSVSRDSVDQGLATLVDTIYCAFVPDRVPAEFYKEAADAHARMHRAMNDVVTSGDPDRDFARSMIPHHQGAIDMALVQLKYGRDERVRRLAHAIIAEQAQEIAYLKVLLNHAPAVDQAELTVR